MGGRDGLLRYSNDGCFTIDNMLVERAARCFIVRRNSSMFFSSKKDVKDFIILFTIVETVNIYTSGVKGYLYLVETFRSLMTGEKDYEAVATLVLYKKIIKPS